MDTCNPLQDSRERRSRIRRPRGSAEGNYGLKQRTLGFSSSGVDDELKPATNARLALPFFVMMPSASKVSAPPP